MPDILGQHGGPNFRGQMSFEENLPLKLGSCFPETLGNNHPVTWCNIPARRKSLTTSPQKLKHSKE
jgi:hypothetical protein